MLPLALSCFYLFLAATATNATGAKDEGSPLNISQRGNDVWKKLQVEPQILTHWNANLRMVKHIKKIPNLFILYK